MKLEFQNRWVRLLIELLPPASPIRSYRVMPRPLEASTQRALRRQIASQLRRAEQEVGT